MVLSVIIESVDVKEKLLDKSLSKKSFWRTMPEGST